MKPFQYSRPASLDEAANLLRELGSTAVVFAGGTDLIPMMRIGELAPQHVVDVKHLADLHEFQQDGEGRWHIGAAVTVHELESSPALGESYPALATAAASLGSYPVRCRATIGGNVCRASPSADLLPPLLIYEAEAITYSPAGERRSPLSQFFVGPGQTSLAGDEFLVKLVLPVSAPGWQSAYTKHSPRRAMDLAVVGVATAVGPNGSGPRSIRIALGAVAPTPIRATGVEEEWGRRGPLPWDEVGKLAAAECNPIDDLRASADYRRHIVKVVVARMLQGLSN